MPFADHPADASALPSESADELKENGNSDKNSNSTADFSDSSRNQPVKLLTTFSFAAVESTDGQQADKNHAFHEPHNGLMDVVPGRSQMLSRNPFAAAPALLPKEKPKRLPSVPLSSSGQLDDDRITGLRGRLRLTSDQVNYWPAVEAALRDVRRTLLRGGMKHANAGTMNIDVNSPEVQRLIRAAVPLLIRLREDQKIEVRKLARMLGLPQVASQI